MMKGAALLSAVFLSLSCPAYAKLHHSHHHHTARKLQQVSHGTAHESHAGITCEMVRAYVAQVGLGQALAMAKSAGITAAEEGRARRCLANKT
jgi:hypothetical protein